jgi:hypothetical protein
MNDNPNHAQGYRRGLRIARFLTALAVFASTTAGLHALSNHYGWQHGHWGAHHYSGYGLHSDWDARCDSAQPSTPKQPF